MTDDEFDRLVESAGEALNMMVRQPKTELVIDGAYAHEVPTCIQCGMPLDGPLACQGRCEE